MPASATSLCTCYNAANPRACRYRMCIPCAKAVCSMPDHAPQCPFCRAAITRLLRIAPAL